MEIEIRPLRASDRAEWERLYESYATFYRAVQTADMRRVVWSWILDPEREFHGICAVDKTGRLHAIAHFRPFARPLSAAIGGFLDDLFVDPPARGRKLAEALIAHVREEGVRRGWSVIRWITAEDNYRARAVYDRSAARTNWVTYDVRL